EETRIEDPGNLSPQTSYSRSEESLRGGVLLATPSVSLGYKDYFSLQGGVQLNTNLKTPSLTANGHNKVSVRPFISAGANLLKMIRPGRSTASILSGSLANSAYQGEIIPAFSDLDFSQEPGTSMEYVHPYDALAAQKSIDAWQVGLRLQLFGDRIRIDYNFENNRVAMLRQISVYPNPSVFLTEEIELVQKVHRIRISANAVNTDHFSWRMGVNTASNKSKLILPAQNTGGNPTPSVNPFDSKREWTGGFWNHFRYKKLVAGLNILYHFNDTYYKQTST